MSQFIHKKKGRVPLNIGADWLARTMLSNPVSRIGNAQSQIGTGASDTSNLFVNVLTQFLKQQELQTATPSQMNAFIPDFFRPYLLQLIRKICL